MKISTHVLATVAFLVGAAAPLSQLQAGQEYYSGKKVIAPPIEAATPCFADQEFSIDAFAVYQAAESGSPYDDGFGGGLALNYFFTRNVGITAEAYWSDATLENSALHSVAGSVVVRFPLDEICLAPYVYGGGGGAFDSENNGVVHAGGGLEYRITPEVGIFGDARYQWLDHDANDIVLYRLGVRFVF